MSTKNGVINRSASRVYWRVQQAAFHGQQGPCKEPPSGIAKHTHSYRNSAHCGSSRPMPLPSKSKHARGASGPACEPAKRRKVRLDGQWASTHALAGRRPHCRRACLDHSSVNCRLAPATNTDAACEALVPASAHHVCGQVGWKSVGDRRPVRMDCHQVSSSWRSCSGVALHIGDGCCCGLGSPSVEAGAGRLRRVSSDERKRSKSVRSSCIVALRGRGTERGVRGRGQAKSWFAHR